MRKIFFFSLLILKIFLQETPENDEINISDSPKPKVSENEQTNQEQINPQESQNQEEPEPEGEDHLFQAEISRLLDIIINSLYTNKEIFIREAISNSSDALDKIRFISLQDSSVKEIEPEMSIKITVDKQNNTLTITDTGIGMDKNDLINNLGTIARSGTTQFLEAIKKGGNLNLIGQFGVGFYSYFLVSNKVTVISKKIGSDQYVWVSNAGSTFKIYKDEKGPFMNRGTKVILSFKQDMKEFLEINKIKDLIHRYSEFINFPIYLWLSKEVSKEVPLEEGEIVEEKKEEKKDEEQIALDVNDEDDKDAPILDEKQKKKTKTVKETVWDWEQINENKPIWLKPVEEIEDEEYKKFYKSLTKDYQDPLDWIHFKVEGEIEFTALLYIPKTASLSFMQQPNLDEKSSLKLYVRRVLISDDFKDLLPRYFNFIKGIVDSDDLPLNVSRETLQQLRIIKTIKKKLVKKTLEKLLKFSTQDIEDEYEEEEENMTDTQLDELDKKIEKRKKEMSETYNKFWTEFGKSIKVGIVEDVPNRKNLAEISRWYSTFNNTDTQISLDSYIERKKENQTEIYYLGGEQRKKMLETPVLKGLHKKGYEIILCEDAIDEYTIHSLDKYKDLNFVNIGKSGFKIPQEKSEEAIQQKLDRYYQPLTSWLQELLKNEVEKISLNQHSPEVPMVALGSQQGYSANMEKILKSQATIQKDDRGDQFQNVKRNLELNPYHPFVKELLERVKSGADKETEDSAKLLFQVALLQAGFELREPANFSSNFYKIMKDSFGISRDTESVDLDLSEFDEVKQTEEQNEQGKADNVFEQQNETEQNQEKNDNENVKEQDNENLKGNQEPLDIEL